jgi:hypothetical protein
MAESRLVGSESCTAVVYAVSPAVLDCDQRLELTVSNKAKIAAAIALAPVLADTLKRSIYPVRCRPGAGTYIHFIGMAIRLRSDQSHVLQQQTSTIFFRSVE